MRGIFERTVRNVSMKMAFMAVLAMMMVFGAAGASDAAVSAVTQFSTTPCAGSTGSATSNITCSSPTIGAGANRVVVLVITGEGSGNHTSVTVNATYGAASFTEVQNSFASTNRRYSWIGYIDESQIFANSGSNIAATVTTDVTWAGIEAYYAVYSGVDQGGGTATVPGSTKADSANDAAVSMGPITTVAGGAAIYALSANQTSGDTTVPSGYTEYVDQADSSSPSNYYSTIGSRENVPGTSESVSMTAVNIRWTGVFMSLGVLSGDSLATSAPTDLTTGDPNEGSNGVDMLRFQVDSNNADNGSVELATLDLNDAGNASSLTAHVYISTVSQATLPATAVLLGSTSGWNGNATTINLTAGGTAADRTVTNGTPKYVYIVYDIPSGQGTNTIQATVTGVGVASPDSGATGLNYQSTTRTVQTCNDGNLAVLTITNPTNGNTVGGMVTVTVSVGTEPSPSGMQNMQVLINGTWRDMTWNGGNWVYTWNTLADYPGSSATPVLGVTIDAHGTDVNPCSIEVNASQISVNVDNTDPSKIASCAGCHGYTGAFGDGTSRNNPAGTFPGSHDKHAGQYSMACTVCHVNNTTYSHRDGVVDMISPLDGKSGSYNRGSFAQVNNSTGLTNCSDAYCHSRGAAGTSNTGETRTVEANTSPVWGNNGAITCTSCHGNEAGNNGSGAPHYANDTVIGGAAKKNSHDSHPTTCQTCHNATTTDGTSISDFSVHATGTYNIVAGNGASISNYSYNAGGGTCNTISCHGDSNAQWGVTSVDCTICHGGAIGDRRQVTGAGGDFVRLSRHVNDGTATEIVTKWDCVICHAEGDPATGKTTASHGGVPGGKADTDLRNVDNYAAAWAWNRFGTITTAMRDNMDSFCMGCHDADGASQIAVNNANPASGVLLNDTTTVRSVVGANNANPNSVTVNLRPFNTSDNLRNGNDASWTAQGTETMGTRRTSTYGRVLNVKDQFNSTDATGSSWASHHNLNQFARRYSSKVIPSGAWTSYVTKEGVALDSATAGVGGELAGLHCSDCHLNETNAHGSQSAWYMNQSKDPAPYAPGSELDVPPTTSGQATSTTERMCFRCHNPDTYASNAASATNSRYTHDTRCASGSVGSQSGTQVFGATCFACHGGFSEATDGSLPRGGLGAIHGNNDAYNPGNGGTASKRYRFMAGGTMRFYDPAGVGAFSGPTSWQGTAAGGCYTVGSTTGDVFGGGCTQHNSGKALDNAPSYSRNLDY